eukprot:CAMPEP_0206534990 /NCGR_PEP_ID=MMETSP0325_2-20121206/5871_1 /ASSEMBLY_ACC=CAM_ASM_000347 /TAXON_ID=2866 /ORGANISM="Crypthecodinium cohnii, Strain Seligo" /LENGTH=642 /DNA_ID=CAMNT_0054031893 /DNA_START=62 /DNA_END=1987 /DNA_ORIENTATION=-
MVMAGANAASRCICWGPASAASAAPPRARRRSSSSLTSSTSPRSLLLLLLGCLLLTLPATAATDTDGDDGDAPAKKAEEDSLQEHEQDEEAFEDANSGAEADAKDSNDDDGDSSDDNGGNDAGINSQHSGPPELVQVLVFDAGSSGSRIHIFNAHLHPGANVPEIDQSVRPRQTQKLKPGLSTFAKKEDLDGAEANIKDLLRFADDFVDESRRAKTPVLVKATAGLRAVPQAKANLVLDRVRAVLGASSYKSDDAWVGIIEGKEEGGLAWVAANYLAGTFLRSNPDATSLGVIEMGGGSAQVTFEVTDPSQKLAEQDSYEFVTLLGKEYKVYAHSYLGYGQDYAQEKMKSAFKKALEVAQGASPDDPCYPQGARWITDDATVAKVVAGMGKAKDCISGIWKSLFLGDSSEDAPGEYKGEPTLKGRFVATENFFYTRNDLKLPMLGKQHEMEDVANAVCMEHYSGDAESVPKHCFALAYQAAFLQALRKRPPPEIAAAASLAASAAASISRKSLRGEAPVPKAPPVVGVAAGSTNEDDEGDLSIEITRLIHGGEVDWAVGAAVVHIISEVRGAAPEEVAEEEMESGSDGVVLERQSSDGTIDASSPTVSPAANNAVFFLAVLCALFLWLLLRRRDRFQGWPGK